MADPNTAAIRHMMDDEGSIDFENGRALCDALDEARLRITNLESGRNIEQEALRTAIVRAAAVMALVTPASVPLVPEYKRGWRDGYEGALRDVHRVLSEET